MSAKAPRSSSVHRPEAVVITSTGVDERFFSSIVPTAREAASGDAAMADACGSSGASEESAIAGSAASAPPSSRFIDDRLCARASAGNKSNKSDWNKILFIAFSNAKIEPRDRLHTAGIEDNGVMTGVATD